MSESALKNTIPRTIEARKFAAQGIDLAGVAPHSSFERLGDVAMSVGDVEVELTFKRNEDGKLVAQGHLSCELGLQCQRCLEEVVSKLESNVNWAMVWDDLELKSLPSQYEPWVVGSDAVDLYAMIEEELLLAVPVVAFHDYDCLDESLFSSGEEPEQAAEKDEKTNPFQQALSGLKDSLKN